MRKVFPRLPYAVALLALCSPAAVAEGTRTWQQTTFEDFEKGTANGVAIRSDGGLELAPAFTSLASTPSTYIWSLATDQAGNVYAATGSPARVYRIAPDGTPIVIFAPKELQVQSIVVAPSGAIYAGTSPDGKVYKIERITGQKRTEDAEKPTLPESASPAPSIDSSYTSSILFNPQTKYIWDMALDRQGNLYIATGDRGQIFKVAKTGENSLFFKSDEAHIRVLSFDREGNLIAGSDGSGLVYRISPTGEAFVLYSAPKKEITALAVDHAGSIYAAAVGDKRGPNSPPSAPVPIPPPAPLASSIASGPAAASPLAPFASGAPSGGSEVYRIAPDGSPSRIWNSRDDLVYALAFDRAGALLVGTGNKGRVFAIRGPDRFADLLKASASQVTAFAPAPNGGLYVSTSNFGKVFVLGPGPAKQGTYESDVFDAHIFSRWGRAEVRSHGPVDFFARSGNVDNPDRNWSPWRLVNLAQDSAVGVPPARFVQWKTVLRAGSTPADVDSVVLNYLSKNVAPEIEDITVSLGTRYQTVAKPPGNNPALGPAPGAPPPVQFDAPPPAIHDRDSIGVHWNAHDDNDDDLVYSLYYRGDNEQRWLLLKDKLEDKFYSFDANLLPDGGYTIEVVASDAPSHSPQDALSATKESARFEVDTTPPVIQDLKATASGDDIRISFRAVDSFSPIKRAEYSVDASDWQSIDPVSEISDSTSEAYDLHVIVPSEQNADTVASTAGAGSGPRRRRGDPVRRNQPEHVIAVRVYDRYDNMGSAKYVVRGE